MKKTRCAIYTRKSTEDGLEQEFNSLDAQREACAAYIASQKHQGWVKLPDAYDDGGLSGGSLDRPALQHLLEDIKTGRVDQIVVYKIDRLTRSLADFPKIVDILDAAGASFVSVTQSFNTATSMGRLTLNMLLSFAQFEREVTAERIRDKIAASKRKGLWVGGQVPLGYDPDGRTLAINTVESETIRTLYDLYERFGTLRAVKRHADQLGLRSRRRMINGRATGGRPIDRGHIHHILTNPIYAGRIRHRDRIHDGVHPAIIDPERWDRVQDRLQAGAHRSRKKQQARTISLLCGKIFDETGDRLTPSHSKTKAGTRLRYYISHRLVAKGGERHANAWRLPANELEQRAGDLVKTMLGDPALPGRLLADARADEIALVSTAVRDISDDPKLERRLELIQRIDITPGEIKIQLEAKAIATALDIPMDSIEIAETDLHKGFPFTLRKRGVETRIVLADQPSGRDDALIRNIARAYQWFEQIKAGATFTEIADAEDTSKRRVQQVIPLAFLAPDIVRDVLDGKQPLGFTSDWCLRHQIPSDWDQQRAVLATL